MHFPADAMRYNARVSSSDVSHGIVREWCSGPNLNQNNPGQNKTKTIQRDVRPRKCLMSHIHSEDNELYLCTVTQLLQGNNTQHYIMVDELLF